MKEIFKQIITDFHQEPLPQPSLREVDVPKLPKRVRKAYVFVGMRRSGKTWVLYQQMQQAIKQDRLKKQQILYIDFTDDRLDQITIHDLQLILDAYFELYPDNVNDGKLQFYFDEIQEVSGWEKFIRRLLDTEKMAIYLSGSSAKMLSKEIATALRGRVIVREIFPFSFREYLSYKDVVIGNKLTSKQQAIVKHHMQYFLYYGGFPETLAVGEALHRELLQSYINSVIYRDIVERYKITNIQVLKKLLIHCLQHSSSILSVNKIYNVFKSQGYAISKNSLYEYMEFFEDAYCVFSVPLYDFSERKTTLKSKKIYLVDQGLISAYTIKADYENAARLETAVFSHLRRNSKEIFYYQTRSGKEVDFLTLTPAGAIAIYQVTVSLADVNTKQREISAIQEAMAELQLQAGIIITIDEEHSIKVPEGTVHCIPLSRFLCQDV